jgi:hypothetical protein
MAPHPHTHTHTHEHSSTKGCCSTPIVATPAPQLILFSEIWFAMCVANNGLVRFSMVSRPQFKPSTIVRKVCCSTPNVVPPTSPMLVFFLKMWSPMCVANDGLLRFSNGPTPTNTPRCNSETCVAQPQSSPNPPPNDSFFSEIGFAMCIANDGLFWSSNGVPPIQTRTQ